MKRRELAPQGRAIRRSAQGEACTFQIPLVCNHNPETTVWCHENSYAAGKGMGLKALDVEGAYGCSDCHAAYDQMSTRLYTRAELNEFFQAAKERSREILKRKGLIGESHGEE